MKRTIKLAVVAALALGATSAFATNGDMMIGQGAKSRSMGGVGIATSFGAESTLANPALISTVINKEFTGGVTFFMPDVSFKSNAASAAQGAPDPSYASSEADFSVIPEMYFASRINENWVYGVTIAGTAGMGVDYSDVPFGVAGDNGSFQMETALQILKVAIPFAYSNNNMSVGFSPILQYATLEMSHMTLQGPLQSPEASDTALGYELGFTYNATESITIGAVYKSKLAMTYDDTIGTSINAFGGAQATGVTSGDNLDQPAEYGLGVSYNNGANTIAVDYRNIAWGSADGYKDFGWDDQDVISLGYEFATKKWALRAGYNYASSAIKEQTGSGQAAYGAGVRNFFNLAGFPGMVESHYTFGGGYNISDALSMDVAVVYAAESTNSFDTAGMTQGFIAGAGGTPTGAEVSSADVTHSQLGMTVAMTYKF